MDAFNKLGRGSLGELLDTQCLEAKAVAKKKLCIGGSVAADGDKNVDASIEFNLLSSASDQNETVDNFTLTLNQALGSNVKAGDAYATSKLKKVSIMRVFVC